MKPVFKAGDPSDVTNYRLFSIIPHITKILVSLVYSNIRSLNHLIIVEQRDFR